MTIYFRAALIIWKFAVYFGSFNFTMQKTQPKISCLFSTWIETSRTLFAHVKVGLTDFNFWLCLDMLLSSRRFQHCGWTRGICDGNGKPCASSKIKSKIGMLKDRSQKPFRRLLAHAFLRNWIMICIVLMRIRHNCWFIY